MVDLENEPIIDAYKSFLGSKAFPCVAAKAALAKEQVQCFVADHMACPNDDTAILQFLYAFVDRYRGSNHPLSQCRSAIQRAGCAERKNF